MLRVIPRSDDDLLLVEIGNESPTGVERCLASGADINGSPRSGVEYPPVVYAAAVGSPRMIELLLSKGADVDGAMWREGTFPKHSRAIHVAVSSGYPGALDALRALLRAGASVDAKDARGCTALMMACRVEKDAAARIEMARELLAAGAGVDELDSDGRAALHYSAFSGSTELISLLLGKTPSPSTLNHATLDGKTPLLVAVEFGHAPAVSLLLSAGASQRGVLHLDNYNCPFRGAVAKGDESIVRLLATEAGMRAVGGAARVVPGALSCVVKPGASRILHLVLGAGGEERRAAWANHRLTGLNIPMLHMAAGYGALANVKVLLAAGAVNSATPEGFTAFQVIGRYLPGGPLEARTRKAIARALKQRPAHRARSLAWPVDEGGAARSAAAPAGVGAPLGVNIYRSQSQGASGSLGRLVDRYSKKD